MKLISPFHDYYDAVLAHGRDEHIRFIRRTSSTVCDLPSAPWVCAAGGNHHVPHEVSVDVGLDQGRMYTMPASRALEEHQRRKLWNTRTCLVQAVVVVAGRAGAVWIDRDQVVAAARAGRAVQPDPAAAADADAPAWRLKGYPDLSAAIVHAIERATATCVGMPWSGNERWCVASTMAMDVVSLPEAMEQTVRLSLPSMPKARRRKRSRGYLDGSRREYEQALQAFLRADHSALSVQEQTPVLLLLPASALPLEAKASPATATATVVVRNPCLAALNWQSVSPPYDTFQALSQFIGGVMPGSQSPMVSLKDSEQVLKKGFDPVYGFRTRPSSA